MTTEVEPVRQHDHPMEGPVVIVHARNGGRLDDGATNPAHAFGPFPDEATARAWDAGVAEDSCYKVIIDLFDPVTE